MKKLLFLLLLIPFLGKTQCDHTISLFDTFGDGWNGGTVTVSVNGTPVLSNITLGGGSGPANFTFSATAGDAISITYSAGSWAYENYFDVLDGAANSLVNDWYPDASGTWNGVAACPAPWCNGTESTATLEDFNYTTTIPGIIPGSVYHDTPQTFNVHEGSRAAYYNFQDGFSGTVYDETFTVCQGTAVQVSFWACEAFGDWNDLTIEMYDGASLISTQNIITNGTWTQYTTASMTISSGSVRFVLITNRVGAAGNDLALDHIEATTCDCNPLPVSLAEFYGNCKSIYWRTISEVNASHWELESSIDGISWEFYTSIEAHNSIIGGAYQLNHENDSKYFRLIQYDFNGNNKIYDPIVVSCNGSNDIKGVYSINGAYLGSEIPDNPIQQLYLIQYQDGSVAKIMYEQP